MQEQTVLTVSAEYRELDQYFAENKISKIFLVCGKSIQHLRLGDYFNQITDRFGIEVVRFSDFQPNPLYESVVKGVKLFRKSGCDSIIAVGGGSAMDVAKCVKLYSKMDPSQNYLNQKIVPNDVKLLAIPTTAGTGSEATRYAVIYYQGEKQSVTDDSCIPSTVLMDASVLKTLPLYQKKSTMMDALCHSVESFWSVNSTEESRKYSRDGIQMILANKDAYLNNEEAGNANMLKAANTAGKAINITQTTSGHAMCYKLTSLYGIAHGHAAALCVSRLWPYMLKNMDKCTDPRGEEHLKIIFTDIAEAFGCRDPEEGADKFQDIFDSLSLAIPAVKEEDYPILCSSVNPVRLKNNPVGLDETAIAILYREILKENGSEK